VAGAGSRSRPVYIRCPGTRYSTALEVVCPNGDTIRQGKCGPLGARRHGNGRIAIERTDARVDRKSDIDATGGPLDWEKSPPERVDGDYRV
jgi:hypothetical protein